MAGVSSGNLNLAGGGAFILGDGTNNPSWAQFSANRSAGFGSGANQWQITTEVMPLLGNGNLTVSEPGAFAARGAAVQIGSSGVTTTNLSSSTFNIDFALGSSAKVGGTFYANAAVEIGQDTAFTAKHNIWIAPTGPGLTGAAGTGVVNKISGNLSGAGALVFSSTGTAPTDGQIGEVILSGTNTITGSSTVEMDGGSNVNYVSTGPGGMIISTVDNNPGTRGDVFVRFASQAALPSATTTLSYLLASRYGNINSPQEPDGRSGYGFTATNATNGNFFHLNSGYKMMLGGQYNGPSGATLFSTGDGVANASATLENSVVGLISSGAAVAANADVLVRDGAFGLGSFTGQAGAVSQGALKFESLNLTSGPANGGTATDPGLLSAASVTTDSAARTLIKRGIGTAVLNNVSYVLNDGSTDNSAQFNWLVGTGIAGAFDGGAIRELGTAGTQTLSGVKVKLQGGVIEFGAAPRTLTLGTAIGQIDMSGVGGGGFSAFGGNRNISVNAGAAITWGTTQTANWVASGSPLIFGSTTADSTAVLQNNIVLSANQTINSVRGVNATPTTTPEGQITGAISGGFSLTFNAENLPGGGVLTPGTVSLPNANGYTGGTTINGGAVLISNNSSLGTGAVSVISATPSSTVPDAALQLQGNITVANAITTSGRGINSTGVIRNVSGNNSITNTFSVTTGGGNSTIQSDSGTLTFGAMTVAAGQTTRGIVAQGAGNINVSGVISDGTAGLFTVQQAGPGVLTISNLSGSSYTGGTTVTGGTLLLTNSSGSATGTGTVGVTSGTLAGNASVSGAVTIGSAPTSPRTSTQPPTASLPSVAG